MTLNAFYVRPTCDTADVQAILPFPPNSLQHVLCDVPHCAVDVPSAIQVVSLEVGNVNIVLDETPQEEITHTLRSGDRGGQVQEVLSVAADGQPIDLVYAFPSRWQ